MRRHHMGPAWAFASLHAQLRLGVSRSHHLTDPSSPAVTSAPALSWHAHTPPVCPSRLRTALGDDLHRLPTCVHRLYRPALLPGGAAGRPTERGCSSGRQSWTVPHRSRNRVSHTESAREAALSLRHTMPDTHTLRKSAVLARMATRLSSGTLSSSALLPAGVVPPSAASCAVPPRPSAPAGGPPADPEPAWKSRSSSSSSSSGSLLSRGFAPAAAAPGGGGGIPLSTVCGGPGGGYGRRTLSLPRSLTIRTCPRSEM
mmetsp:Transcript_20371/g.50956  ORF Transcript_20371/g.50956 Transcript_20371/m.50956 type:complete len:258 (-) Transcript_20371:43-816(-)